MARPELASAGTSVSRCITAATLRSMDVASVRDLRNHGGEILDRVEAGARVTVTRDGRPVARLEPLGRRALSAAVLIERFRRLPRVDSEALRADLDAALDQSL